ncbi:MAG: hypothetical protein LAT82_06040 [Nanoarchaeota archaeon]|nr:hypothetical protein [Nanoarchaeota archaeon]
MYQVFLLPQIEKELKKLLTKKETLELKKFILEDLTQKGDKVGNQLTYPFLREKKIVGKRIYYLVYKEIAIILIVGSSDKKMRNNQRFLAPKVSTRNYKLYQNIS